MLTTIQMHGVSCLKKNTHLPSNLTFTTGSSLFIRIISFFMVRNAGHILLNQFYILKDTKWGCKAAGTRTNIDFHVSASATYSHSSSRMQMSVQGQGGALWHVSKGIPLPLRLIASLTTWAGNLSSSQLVYHCIPLLRNLTKCGSHI